MQIVGVVAVLDGLVTAVRAVGVLGQGVLGMGFDGCHGVFFLRVVGGDVRSSFGDMCQRVLQDVHHVAVGHLVDHRSTLSCR